MIAILIDIESIKSIRQHGDNSISLVAPQFIVTGAIEDEASSWTIREGEVHNLVFFEGHAIHPALIGLNQISIPSFNMDFSNDLLLSRCRAGATGVSSVQQ